MVMMRGAKSTNKRLVLVVRNDEMKLPDRALVCLGFKINVDWTIWAAAERQSLVAPVDFCGFGGYGHGSFSERGANVT